MKSAAPVPPPGRAVRQQQTARLLRILFSRITSLMIQAKLLCTRVSGAASYASLRTCLESLLHELRTAARELAARASALGARINTKRARALHLALARRKMAEHLEVPAQLAGVLLAECQACGPRLCTLMQTAQSVQDQAAQRIAYSLMRMIEKQLWLLRPHAVDTTHPFPPHPRLA